MFTAMLAVPLSQANAVAGTTGTLTSTIDIYNPGTPTTIEGDSLTDGAYYAVLIGANLATAYQQWFNFTANGATKTIPLSVNNAAFSGTTKLTVELYGAANDSTAGTLLDSYEFSLIKPTTLLGYDWFMTVIFPILILVIVVGIVVGLASIFTIHQYNKKKKGNMYQE